MADNNVMTMQEPDEEYSPIAVKDLDKERVKLGRQGENGTQSVVIDANDWLVSLQGCTFMVVATRPGEHELYVPDITVTNGMITWPIMAQDTACAGAGRAEVRALKGDAIKKSKLFRTWIEPALDGEVGGTPTVPPNWVKETKENLERANQLMADAVAAANAAAAAAAGLDADVDEAKGQALDAITAAQAAAVEAAAADMDASRVAAVEGAETAMEAAKDAKLEEIDNAKTNAEQIAGSAVEIAQAATVTAAQALEKASNAENDSATFATDIDLLKEGMVRYEMESGTYFGGAFLDESTNTLYFTDNKGRVLLEIEDIGRGGGGGGGGGDDSGSASKISMSNISGWQSKTLAEDEDGNVPACPVTFLWSSLENDLPTGNGSLRISVNDRAEAMLEVPQGENTIDVAPYLRSGTNMFDFTVYDIYGKNRSIRFTVDLKVMYITSTFDNTQPYKSAFPFPYTPNGSVRKVVHFEMDGTEIGTVETSTNGHQQSFTVPQQTHGAHVLRVWFVAEINGQTVRSNTLYYEIICIDPLNTAPIIVSNFGRTTVQQYETLKIDYNVYDPMNLEAPVTIDVDGVRVSSLTASRETQSFTYRVSRAGNLTIEIKSGETTKTLALVVTESEVHPEAVADQLSLHLDAAGRSNSENDPAVWEYGTGAGKIAATFEGFNWTRDGWQRDDDGLTCLEVMGGSMVTIPALVYGQDFRASGKTIELEFMSHDVLDYDSPIISCMSGNRGFEVYPDHAVFKSARAEVNCRFTTDRRTRLTLAVEPQSANRLVYLYIDGVYQGISQYSTTDSYQQADPVGITIGNNPMCGVKIYNTRVYDRYLTAEEVLGNYIADRQDAFEMLELYQRNDIFENGKITISKLPKDLPYVILTGPESPQYKGDKKTVEMVFDEPTNATRHLTAQGVQVNVQGTSSQYYAVKNLKITFKNGATVNGHLVIGFTIREGSIMVDEFTLKADVASSESANNIVLAILFDTLAKQLGIKTPPQKENANIRQGMDGFPCVVFWDYGDGPEFVGKYNFNNDKGTPDTFGFTEGDEIWDVRNFDSQLSKFKTNVFDENWTNEYESIYPEEYFDCSKLQAMTDFIYSTWQEAATGDALDAPVTYDGTEYTHDTAAYRLAKFKAEYGNWYDLDNAAFYYVFTLVFLMADSRQKNEHLAWWHQTQKWWELIYDCDTALGTDNRGALTFEYWMEDIDQVGGGNVYNGQDNVKWVNWRQAFWKRSAEMYQRMRSSGLFNAEYVKRIFHEWQQAWPEAVWNEDGDFKYVAPVRKDGTTTYLPMALGNKSGQRDEFLDWRFPYCDSMFDMGDALLSILFRPFYTITEEQRASGDYDVIVDLHKKGYVTVMWDDHKTGGRMVGDNLSCRCENPYTYANDAVCAIHNAKMVKAVHGMENLYVRFWDSSYAENLEEVVLGSNKAGYRNEVTREVSVGANKKLLKVDMRNCVNFGTGTQKTLPLSQCPNLTTVYMDGTQVQGVDLPNGGILETLHLPATTSSLVIRNQPRLTDAGLVLEGWENIDQLWLENMSGLDTKAIFNRVPAATAIRITGFYWEATDAAEIEAIMDRLDIMRGIEINGQGQGMEVDTAQMSGTIHTSALRGDDIASWKERYPTINVVADHTSSTLTCKSWDGSTTIKTIQCADGVPQEALPAVPTRTSTAQYSYTAVGWNREMDASTAQSDAGTNVLEDRVIYAAYSRTVRSYTITWANDDNSTLATETYNYGQRPSYKGSTPVSAVDSSRPFTQWTPTIVDVTGNATYKASYIPIYTATFVKAAEDGGGTLHTANFQDGQTVTYGGSEPTSTREGYTFNGWTPALGVIHANTTYTALFKAPSDAPTATTADGAYGVEWDYSSDATTLTRKGLAASFANPAPATDLAGSGSSPFDSIQPWAGMKRYNVVNGSLVPDTNASFDEAANDTVVYIPEFYYTAYKDTANSKWLWAISPTAKEGYKKHPGSGVYVGRFHTSGDATAVFSKGGVAPLANITRANGRTYSAAKGTGWRQMDLKVWSAIQLLYLVEFANWHSQDTLGKGQNSGSVKNTGLTTGAVYHTIKRDGNSNAYRWIENPFSNLLTWVDGFVATSKRAYVSTDPASYGDSTSGMEQTGITLPSSNYITGMGYSEKCAWAFIPDAASGGSATTHVPDYVSSSTNGDRVLSCGGDCSANDYYGAFFFLADYSAAIASGSIGSRLLYQP